MTVHGFDTIPAANDASSTRTPKDLIKKNFTKVPNAYLDNLMLFPPSFTAVFLAIVRKTVGFWKWSFDATIEELGFEAGVADQKSVRRWVQVMDAVDWIDYEPARNGGGKSRIRLGDAFPGDSKGAKAAVIQVGEALMQALKARPRRANKEQFVTLFRQHLDLIRQREERWRQHKEKRVAEKQEAAV